MEKLKIAIVGCGGIANQKHMPSIRANAEKAEMVAFCDIIPERAQKAAEEYGTPDAKVYTDYKAMLADHEIEIDVVHVCTPNVAHCPITVAAFEAGKHVMCEKPMAHNTADARKMIEAWKKSGKKFTIGYQNRLRDDTQTLHASCENRELGEIYFAKAHALRRRAVPTWGVFPNKALQGGGPLIDIGTHALDITLWMMNNPFTGNNGFLHHNLSHQIGKCRRQVIRIWVAQTDSQGSLGICVHQKHLFSFKSQANAQILGGGGLAGSSFLIDHRNDGCFFRHLSSLSFLSLHFQFLKSSFQISV